MLHTRTDANGGDRSCGIASKTTRGKKVTIRTHAHTQIRTAEDFAATPKSPFNPMIQVC